MTVLIADGGPRAIQMESWLREAGHTTVRSQSQEKIWRLLYSRDEKFQLVILGDLGIGTSKLITQLVDHRRQPTITTWWSRSYFETPYVRHNATREQFLQTVTQVLNQDVR